MSDSVQLHRWQPTRAHHPWDSPGKNTGVGCHFLLQCMKVKSESEVAQSCPILSDPMDCSLPGSSVHGVFQARVLEWGAIAFSKIKPEPSTNITFIFLINHLNTTCLFGSQSTFCIFRPLPLLNHPRIPRSKQGWVIRALLASTPEKAGAYPCCD